MYRHRNLYIGLLLLLFVSIPYVRLWLEESMVGTMFIQYTLLIVGGYYLGKGFPRKWRSFFLYFNNNGIAGIIIVLCVLGYWMLPRAMDAALNEPYMEVAKYISLPFFVGVLLYNSWQLLGPISKSFIWANLISKIFVMSWLYWVSPVRLCNNYLVSAQEQLGKALFILGLAICILFMGKVFIGTPKLSMNKDHVEQQINKMNITPNNLDERLT